jgi:branched-chain amino acid aminotransferase/4-amino-4-deoxychorismate lyase
MASKEKAERNLDDLIILDPNGNLAELTYSNLFWVKEQTLYTPSLETGCLHGIMRRALFSWATQQKWETREGKFTPGELQEAEMVFAGNVTGLRPIEQVEGRALSTQPALFQHLNATLGF